MPFCYVAGCKTSYVAPYLWCRENVPFVAGNHGRSLADKNRLTPTFTERYGAHSESRCDLGPHHPKILQFTPEASRCRVRPVTHAIIMHSVIGEWSAQ